MAWIKSEATAAARCLSRAVVPGRFIASLCFPMAKLMQRLRVTTDMSSWVVGGVKVEAGVEAIGGAVVPIEAAALVCPQDGGTSRIAWATL